MAGREEEHPGYGTIEVQTMEELTEIYERFGGLMISPGGAAHELGVSRAYVHQLEKEKKIRAYRLWEYVIKWDSVPGWARMMIPKRGAYIYIPWEDVQRVKAEMIAKAEARLKKLRGE